MKHNVSQLDRIIRITLAIVLIVIRFASDISGVWGIILLVVGVILALTGFLRFCPLYLPFHIDTNKYEVKEEKEEEKRN